MERIELTQHGYPGPSGWGRTPGWDQSESEFLIWKLFFEKNEFCSFQFSVFNPSIDIHLFDVDNLYDTLKCDVIIS